MRPYRVMDEELDEDEQYPRVVPIGAGGRTMVGGLTATAAPQPWTPRDGAAPVGPRRHDSAPATRQAGLGRAHRWMIGAFAIVCVGMVLGMVMVRVWDEASRTVAALPPEGSAAQPRQSASAPAPPQSSESPVTPSAPAAGAVTTEVRVLQPNYTVAPGDTLGSIAKGHGTSVDALASINNLENRNSLRVGQKLIIP